MRPCGRTFSSSLQGWPPRSITISLPAAGGGNSVAPLWFLGAAALLNIWLDLLFVLGFGWGVAGAAAATVIAQYVSGIGLLAYALAGPVGPWGIWAAIPIGWFLADAVGYGYYFRCRARLLVETS